MKKTLIGSFIFGLLAYFPSVASAFNITPPASVPQVPYDDGGTAVSNIIISIIQLFTFVGFIGVMVMVVWGAVEWILSGGDKEKIAAARKRITHAIVGLFLIGLSMFIIALVSEILFDRSILGTGLLIPSLGGQSRP
jgi:hypothetical protein